MKFVSALLVLMIAAQPVQAGFCDMESGGDTAAQAGQQHHPGESSGDHGCCDPTDSDSGTTCSDRMHCGFCAGTAAALPMGPVLAAPPDWATPLPLSGGIIAPSHASPPYRPPIAIS